MKCLLMKHACQVDGLKVDAGDIVEGVKDSTAAMLVRLEFAEDRGMSGASLPKVTTSTKPRPKPVSGIVNTKKENPKMNTKAKNGTHTA